LVFGRHEPEQNILGVGIGIGVGIAIGIESRSVATMLSIVPPQVPMPITIATPIPTPTPRIAPIGPAIRGKPRLEGVVDYLPDVLEDGEEEGPELLDRVDKELLLRGVHGLQRRSE